jgi:hypothetical protein
MSFREQLAPSQQCKNLSIAPLLFHVSHSYWYEKVAAKVLLPPSYNKSRYGMRADQTFSTLTRLVGMRVTFIFSNTFIMTVYSTIYLMIQIMYYKY